MRELGWPEGKNVEYLSVSAENKVNRVDALANERIARQVEVIVVGASQTEERARVASVRHVFGQTLA
jgi:hypothetical protein